MAEQVNIIVEDSTAQVNISVASGGGVSEHSKLTLDDGTNPHTTTKTDVGLSNILNVDLTPAVDLNTAKVGITTAQASDIVTNNAKISYTDASSVALNTAKVSYIVNVFTSLTDAANISWDALNDNAKVTLAGSRTLDNPTNLVSGRTYNLIVTQDATGTRLLNYGSIFKWQGGTVPTLSTAANAIDIFTFIYDGTNLYGSVIQNFS